MSNRFHQLVESFAKNHNCEAQWLRSEHVHETWRGETVWEGDVQIFALRGHPAAELAYAWSYQTSEGVSQIITVLGVPPVKTAADAVRSAIRDKHERG